MSFDRCARISFVNIGFAKVTCVLICMCSIMSIYMKSNETPEEVRLWFLSAIAKLWPVAEGSLSFRSCPCIRKNCGACRQGKGHASYVLYASRGKRRRSIYVPNEIAPDIATAIKNGRRLRQLINEVGVRYTNAVKQKRALELTQQSRTNKV
jgi:hypothetical protein